MSHITKICQLENVNRKIIPLNFKNPKISENFAQIDFEIVVSRKLSDRFVIKQQTLKQRTKLK